VQTRRDLYQAHRLMTQRVALALLQAEPDAPESPMRRLGVATFSSIMVAVLVTAGFGVWGLIFKGGAQGLEKPGTLIIESETGTKYGYSAQDHKLIPFLNYASARLAMPTDQVDQRTVSRASLAKFVRGPVSGIVGAPDSLPDPKKLAKAPWSLCVDNAASPTGLPTSVVSLIGGEGVGGRSLGSGQAVLVQASGQSWLVWNNQRMRVASAESHLLSNDQPVSVADKWLNGLPQGPDFAAPDIPGRGQTVAGPAGQAQVGQVYEVAAVAGSQETWFVQMTDGLAGISQTEAALLLADTRNTGALSKPVQIPASAAASRTSATQVHKDALPQTMPTVTTFDPSQPLCVVYAGTDKLSTDAHLTIGGSLPNPHTQAVAAAPSGPAGGLDQVVLRGGGTLAGALTGPGQRPQSYFLITDQNIRYPIPTADDVAKLGYSAGNAVPVPVNLLQLIPQGPALTAQGALTPVPMTSPSTP
jgi:type VII secretion protein EccB